MTNGPNENRYPAIFTDKGKEDLWLKSYVSGDIGFGIFLRNISREQWTKIKMHQFSKDEKIYFEILRDGISEILTENTTPTEFFDMTFWCADKFRSVTPNMKLRNLKHAQQSTCNLKAKTIKHVI